MEKMELFIVTLAIRFIFWLYFPEHNLIFFRICQKMKNLFTRNWLNRELQMPSEAQPKRDLIDVITQVH